MSPKPLPKKPRLTTMDIRPVKRATARAKTAVAATPAAVKASPKKAEASKPRKPKRRGFWEQLRNHPLRSHPFVIPVVTFIMLSFVSMVAFVISNGRTLGPSDTRIVNFSLDGEQQTVPTRAKNIKEFLERLEITVSEKDIVEPALDTEIIDNNTTVTVYKARPLTIIDGENEVTTEVAGQTVRAAVGRAGVKIYPEDKLLSHAEVVETEDVLRGRPVAETVVIDRATPATINLYGSLIPIRTHVTTVGEALKEKNIITQPDDVVTPALDTPLSEQTQVFITRVGTKVEAREEVIAMPVETVNDPNLAVGRTVIRQQGNPGRKVVTYEIVLENDKEVARRPIQEIIAVAPTTQVVVRGAKPPTVIVAGDHASLMLQAGIPASQHGSAEYIISRESGWRLNAQNASGCLGLGQACPGSKLINACPDYANNAICQLRFFTAYVNGRYGSWNGAYQFWIVNHWY